jgi:hypothetical protein
MVTSDSLAADSIRAGGDFGANQKSTGISDQPSRGFTGKTTDTSGARELSGEDDTTQSELDSDIKYGKDAGVGPTYNTRDTSNYANTSATEGDGTNYGGQGGVAPTSMWNNTDEKVYKPKGANLKEGGEITGDEPNESFRAEIGSKNDPGLAAENKMARMNADAASASGFKRDSGLASESGVGYDTLRDEEA